MVIMVVMLVSIVTYVVAQLLIMALSRYRELAADRGGAILTGQPENLARALIKIQDAVSKTGDRDLREVKEGASAFFIIPALKKGSMAAMFGTHPPVEERVRRLRQMQQDLEA
jgi:heat shock protein HtpX